MTVMRIYGKKGVLNGRKSWHFFLDNNHGIFQFYQTIFRSFFHVRSSQVSPGGSFLHGPAEDERDSRSLPGYQGGSDGEMWRGSCVEIPQNLAK